MPPLAPLLEQLGIATLAGDPSGIAIEAVVEDSRRAAPGSLFVAIDGAASDGHSYLKQAAERGAAAALVQSEAPAPTGFPLIRVPNTRRALALLAQRLAGDPSHAMLAVGITGTKGKTTVVYLMEAIFAAAGLAPGVIGTVNYRWPGHSEPAPNTTPSPVALAAALAAMRAAGARSVAMEISSHAIEQHRVDGIRLAAAAMTNLSHEHLDYHKSMDAYAAAKERLFTDILAENPESTGVFNADDATARSYIKSARSRRVLTFSLARSNAHIFARDIVTDAKGMLLRLRVLGRDLAVRTPMIGTFNAANCLTAVALGVAAGIGDEAIVRGIASMPGAPGRFEPVDCGQPFRVIVDYAHTPDSLRQLLENTRRITPGRVIVVFGAGGDRDATKRRPMGLAAARLADIAIVTNDNPRTEDPAKIAATVAEGVVAGLRRGREWHRELDRRKAIETAIGYARPGDAVVIAGKGHEDYQILGAEKIHFDDREVARDIIRRTGIGKTNHG